MKQKVWFRTPARRWREALPLGNGTTGMMVFGGIKREKIALNDGTLWSGYPKNQTNPESKTYLQAVRELVFAGKNREADALCREKLAGGYSESYLPLGDLLLELRGLPVEGYERSLELSTAVHTVHTAGAVREAFCSYPDQVGVYHLESKTRFSMKLKAFSRLKHRVTTDGGLLCLSGNAPDFVAPNYLFTKLFPIKYNEGKGMSFGVCAKIETDGEILVQKRSVTVKNATQATIYIATATGFLAFDQMPATERGIPLAHCLKKLLAVRGFSYEALKARHVADYSAIWEKQDISLNRETSLSTDELIRRAKQGAQDPALADLFYHFGKYLILSGSREGGQALNLQGIWNKDVRPAWSSNYTVNINTQMNYWAATRSGLADCIEPFVRLVREVTQAGRRTAQVNYGCSGSCSNHNVDLWRKTTPVKGTPAYMYAPLCGVWLANELYSHFKNGALRQYRETVLECVRDAAAFCSDYLVLHNGCYVTAPSASPEATFGGGCSLDYASAFEMGLVRQAFTNFLEACPTDTLTAEIRQKQAKLYPFKKGSSGLLEWHDDRVIDEKGHRHFSPLYAFYPGNELRFYRDKEQTAWVRELFGNRTQNSRQFIGWNAAWAMCLAGRLHDGEEAHRILTNMLAHSVFYNLFAVHPPLLFQIDGNLGFVAGVNELLVYEEDGVIDLLPALPSAWPSGQVRNMVVCGARLSFTWENGEITALSADRPVTVSPLHLGARAALAQQITVVDRGKKG